MEKYLLDQYNNRIKITPNPETLTTIIEINGREQHHWPILPTEMINWIEASLIYGISVFTVFNTLRQHIFKDEPGDNFLGPNAA